MDLSYLVAAVLAANLLVFLGGCVLAGYRVHNEHRRQGRLPGSATSRAVPFRHMVGRAEGSKWT